jgi:hypothetical protein
MHIQKIILLHLIILLTHPVFGQYWEKFYGVEETYDYIGSLNKSYDGGYIFGGYSGKYQEIGGTRLYKIDINGDTLWSKSLILNEIIEMLQFKPTDDGGFIICGIYYLNNKSKPFVSKFNACTEPEWCKISISDNHFASASDLVVLNNGNYIVSLLNMGDLQTEMSFLVKLSHSGELMWGKPVIDHDVYPEAFQPVMTKMIKTMDSEDLIISGRAYWKNPWNDQYVIRPTFAMYDTQGNEKWVTPFGLADTLRGRGNYCIELDSMRFLCTGRHYLANLQNGYLILIDSSGVIQDYRIVFPEDINDEWYGLFFDHLQKFDSSIVLNLSYFIAPTVGLVGVINANDDIFGEEFIVNALELLPDMRYPHMLARDEDKLFYGTQYRLNAYDYDIYLRKMNAMLELDSITPDTNVYDTLCPYPITYSEIFLDNCGFIDIISSIAEHEIKYSKTNIFRILVSPNPVSGNLRLSFPDAEMNRNVRISIFNAYGQVLESYKLENRQEINHDTGHLPAGLYLVVAFKNGVNIGMCKFIKL